MSHSFNTEPYYDDYDVHKKFHRILFRPGYSVQARELTQLQSMIQEQIARAGNSLFKNGTMIIPGELSFDMQANYVKLNPLNGLTAISTYLNEMVGLILVGSNNGVKSQIVAVSVNDGVNPDTIYIKYLDSGSTTTTALYDNNEILTPTDTNYSNYVLRAAASSATGKGALASIAQGIYYVNGNFVLCEPQVLIISKYTNTPTISVGLNIVESIVSSNDDESLLDNAKNSYNFAAPGADRYRIELILDTRTALNQTTETEHFIQLVTLLNGEAQNVYNRTTYTEIGKTLARRTYDESGDYTVKDFIISPREHRNNDRSTWATATSYIIGDIVVKSGLTYVAETSATSGSGVGVWPTDVLTTFSDGGVTWRYTAKPKYNRGVFSPANGGLENHLALALESGKAYVKGFEIEKIATTYLAIPKSRDYNSVKFSHVDVTEGNYVLVTAIHGMPDLRSNPVVKLYNAVTTTPGSASANGQLIGTAWVRAFEIHSGVIGNSTAIYKVGLINVQLKSGFDFAKDVKQLFIDVSDTNTNFTADISPVLTQLHGTVTSNGTDAWFIGVGTTFSFLRAEDIVVVGGTQYRITVVNNDNKITVSTVPAVHTGVNISLMATGIHEPNKSAALFLLDRYVKSVRDNGVNVITYTVNQTFSAAANASYVRTITLPTGSGFESVFASGDAVGNYIGTYGNGVVEDLTGKVVLSNSDKTATITFTGSAVQATIAYITATINKTSTGDTEKSKVITYTTTDVVTSATGTIRIIKLPHADGVQLISVMMSTGGWGSGGPYNIDITNRYTFDNGQKDSYYDNCKLILKDSESVPSGDIRITYSYFEHTTGGDYFTINSYNVPYESIPKYNGTSLGDVIDFRPRISNTTGAFSGTGASMSRTPKRGFNLNCAYEYYLGRSDIIMLEQSGDFKLTTGVPSWSPTAPPTTTTGMLIATLTLNPYTINTSSIALTKQDNRRYTMRDIGRLETRINNLEYYTTLSATEHATMNTDILDSDGLNRYKTGFIIDSFNAHGIGDITAPDYNCCIDPSEKILRCAFSSKNISMYETDSANRSGKYTRIGDLVTLPYTDTALIVQPFNSNVQSVNPHKVYHHVGHMHNHPETDDWVDHDHVTKHEHKHSHGHDGKISKHGNKNTHQWDEWTRKSRDTIDLKDNFGKPDNKTLKTDQLAIDDNSYTVAQVEAKVIPLTLQTSTTDITAIPFMRERHVVFKSHGLKANTTFFSSFDDIQYDENVTPATRFIVNNISGRSNAWDGDIDAGSSAEHAARKIEGTLDLALSRGHIIRGGTSGALGVVIHVEDDIANNRKILHVVNVIGAFQSETVYGSVDGNNTSDIRGTIASVPTIKVKGNPLVSNKDGSVCGFYKVVNNNKIKFQVGKRKFKIVDKTGQNLLSNVTSWSACEYSSINYIDDDELKTKKTKHAHVHDTIIENDKKVLNTHIDPLAQIFTIPGNHINGVFATKIDLYFTEASNNSEPIHVEIREVSLGKPTNNVVANSTTTIQRTRIVVDPTGVNATTIQFKGLVYLEENKEYAIVIMADSNKYEVAVGEIDKNDTITQRKITTNPMLGAMLKSSNGVVWESSISQNLKFTLYRAFFNINATGIVALNNIKPNASLLPTNPISITNGSRIVRVHHKNHHHHNGSRVIMSGATTIGNISASEFNATNIVLSTDADSYTMQVATTANTTTTGGGAALIATEDALYDVLYINSGHRLFPGTNAEYRIKTTSGKSLNGTETPYIKDVSETLEYANANIVFDSPRVIASAINSQTHMSNAASLDIIVTLKSPSDNISPILDLSKFSATLIHNKVNAPHIVKKTDTGITFQNNLSYFNNDEIDNRTIVSVANKIGFDGATNTIYTATSNTAEAAQLQTLSPGRYITITGDVTDVPTTHVSNNGEALVTGADIVGSNVVVYVDKALNTITPNVNNTIGIVQHQRFIDEICPQFGTALNKYISREIILPTASTLIKIYLAVNANPYGSVDVYYRTNPIGNAKAITEFIWTKAVPDSPIVLVTNDTFVDVSYTAEKLPSFDSLQVKIVLGSTSSSNAPQYKDLRIVACA